MRLRPLMISMTCACMPAFLFLGTTYKTISIDGIKDFSPDETVEGTSGSTWYFTWDASYLYLGAENADVGNISSTTRWLLWYVDTDPRLTPSQGSGTVTGVMYNTQRPTLPFTANYHLRWKVNDSYFDLQTFNGSAWESGNQSGLQRSRSGNFMELRIPRENIGSPDQVYICAMAINETGGAEWTYYIVPPLQSDGYNPALAHFLGFTLDPGRSPNDPGYVDTPLPVQLTSFKASVLSRGGVSLTWTTASEINNYGFEVQCALNGSEQFAVVPGGFIPGQGTTLVKHEYSFIDGSTGNGSRTYRLRQIDLDGSSHFSEPVHVGAVTAVTNTDLPFRTQLFPNYPNPFNPSTTIRYGLPNRSHVMLTIFNSVGQQVALLQNEEQAAGYHQVQFDGTDLSSGVYFYRLQAGSFVETRKFLLLR
jgi:hypothetical protein